MKKLLLFAAFSLFLLPFAVMGQCGKTIVAEDAEKSYPSLKVGPHCWMQYNLSTKVYGSKIYKSDMYPDTNANLSVYGRLYNWYAAMNVQPGQSPVVGEHGFVQGICPEGWHLPIDVEVSQLMTNSTPSLHDVQYWLIPGTNTTTYTMRPGGYYNTEKNYGENLCGNSFMWTAQSLDENNPLVVWSDCHCDHFVVDKASATDGMSVRCVYKIYQGKVTTDSATNITKNSATLYGTVAFSGFDESYERGFAYGTDPDNLDQWVVENPEASEETTPFNKEITGLTIATTYYYQAYIVNDFDTTWGELKDFSTLKMEVTTDSANHITHYEATLHGNLIYLGYTSVNAGFKYGTSEDALTSVVANADPMTAIGKFHCDITGLTANTQYYFKAFAASGTDTVYGVVKDFTTTRSSFTCGTSKVKDVDNNEYNTVQIGNQCWMKENLRTTRYADNTSITLITSTATSSTTAYCYYPNGSEGNVSTYGYLYNWPAVMHNSASSEANPSEVQDICPEGWHVPSDAEWTQLTTYVNGKTEYQCNGTAGNIANALSGGTWNAPSTCGAGRSSATFNKTGFAAVPAENYYGYYGNFGSGAYFWSATQYNSDNAYGRYLSYYYASVITSNYYKYYGFSVRCLKDAEAPAAMTVTTDSANTVTNSGAKLYGNVTDMGGKTEVKAGFKYGTSEVALTSIAADESAMYGTGKFNYTITSLAANTQYYYKAFAANGTDTVYGEVKNFTTPGSSFTCGTSKVKDVDNNEYNTVQIGNQCWMKENLRTTRYADGTSIELGTSTSTTTAYRYYPKGQETYVSTYGYLYNWKAVMRNSSSSSANPSGVQGICPNGWHVPSDAEWTQLTGYVSSQSQYVCGGNNTDIAKALASTTGWSSSSSTCTPGNNPSANNATGFSAVPAGSHIGYYSSFGDFAFFWSATQNFNYDAYRRGLNYDNAYVYGYPYNKYYGFSVRCLKDAEAPAVMTVTTDSANTVTNSGAKLYGNVTDMGGKTEVKAGFKYGTSEGALTSIAADESAMYGTGKFNYTITGLAANTQYYYKAFAANGTDTVYGEVKDFTTTGSSFTCGTSKVKDVDNNEYNTVQIGNQCWMAQNLRTSANTKGRGNIYTPTTDEEPGYDVAIYGRLYDWDAVMQGAASSETTPSNVQGICPDGWHVPSDAEWDTLTYYVYNSTNPDYKCTDCSSSGWTQFTECIAKSLASATGWESDNTNTCAPGNDQAPNNATGFSAVPAGSYDNYYYFFGKGTYFWSATQDDSGHAYGRYLYYNYASVYWSSYDKSHGYSVRCLRDSE